MRPDISETARRDNEKGIVGYADYSHGGMMDYLRVPITERNIGKFPDSMEFQSWKLDFRTEVFMRTAEPQVTMLWIARRTGSPRGVHNRRRRTREGPEPACVQKLLHGGWNMLAEKGEITRPAVVPSSRRGKYLQ